jgi:hypothetical protein
MNKKSKRVAFVTYLFIFLAFFHLKAYSQESAPPCYFNLATQFFKYEITVQAFGMNNIDQSVWSTLVTQLNQQARQVPQWIRAEAQKYRPNPLNRPVQAAAASQILYNNLYACFKLVLLQNNVTAFINEVAIGSMFRYIWMQQLQNIQNCLGREAIQQYILTQ